MRILYDHQAFTIQEYGGISRYFYELNHQFKKTPGLTVINSLLFSNNEYIKNNDVVRSVSFFKNINLQKRTETMNLLNRVRSRAIYKGNNFDLFHPTYYDPYFSNIRNNKPVVITFHDLIQEKFQHNDQRTPAHKKIVLNRADKIISVSASSKKDLMEYYHVPEAKITTIHLGSSIAVLSENCKAPLEGDYLLYVGSRNDYKNFLFFVSAIAPLLVRYPALFLCCIGGGEFTRKERLMFQELKIVARVKWHASTDEDLGKFYSHALAFFFPSLYEGFGLPLLEAMNCGCPVGASETSSLPEVAGNAALYFDPRDKESILSVAETLVTDQTIREKLRQNGFLRAKDFSWQKTAALTHDVYASLM